MLDCQDTINAISVSLVIVYGKRADLAIRSKTNVHFDVSFLTAKVVITTEDYFSFFNDLKQWAGDPKRRVRIRDQKGTEIDLSPYENLKDGDFDPIEVYAYYIGLKKKHIAAIALSVAICVGATGCKLEEVRTRKSLLKKSTAPSHYSNFQ